MSSNAEEAVAQQPQVKRVRINPSAVQPQPLPSGSATAGPSSATGTTMAPPPTTDPSQLQNITKPSAASAPLSSLPHVPQPLPPPSTSSASTPQPIPAIAVAPAAATKPKPAVTASNNFIADAHEAVRFRAVYGRDPTALAAEIAAGGQLVTVDFLHQHFGDAEQIRGYSGLVITIWIHVQTYHVWVDIRYAAKRPGADKLSSVFEGAFPSGYCRTKEEFISTSVATAAALPDLLTLGECVGAVPLPASATPAVYGTLPPPPSSHPHDPAPASTAAAATASGDVQPPQQPPQAGSGAGNAAGGRGGGVGEGSSSRGGVEVSVRRFQISTAPPEVKALHARMEPLLLFTIDGANFIDADDPQWELLLPVARAADGGCLVMGLTTLFNFYAYPASCRLRVSQVLVLSPWQGLGLGKALLKLSYDLAQARGCADLTVEDPTPNLQRVREKLEVEMMRGLDWVRAQAHKCLEAAACGETSWPAWQPPASLAAADAAAAPAACTSAAADTSATTTTTTTSGTTSSTAMDVDTDQPPPDEQLQDQQRQPEAAGRQQGPQHPLLASHAFFSALGAVPPESQSLPEAVLAEATAAAAERLRSCRSRATEAETGGAGGAAADGAAAADAAAADAAGTGAAEVAATAGGAEVAEAAGGQAGGDDAAEGPVFGALVPSAAFVSAVTRELKMHRGQVRVVWEALLWCTPGALSRPVLRSALEALVQRRLELQHFSSVGRIAASKRLVDTLRTTVKAAGGAEPGDEVPNSMMPDFFMYRPMGPRSAVASSASGSSSAAAAADTDAVAVGRLNLTQVSAQDKASRMSELLQERRQQLESLSAVLNRQQQQKRPQQQQPTTQQQQAAGGGGSGACSGGAGVGSVAPAAAGTKRKATDVAAMMKALEGRF
ncbi:hypothetical protein Agub_g14498 [Astrephomene gubernaculifera]|uniref:histone acetyltransferase n=1 Tax=Astrephomene gubernaculifera TaxID=47775 RepID=A0AAD3E1I5_9CHLO|nr:hypothetical protein Agub_g14498 [Astrephomene gubernaculifera]